MPVIGVTGGIASGKSTVARLLAEKLKQRSSKEVCLFSADDYSHELLELNREVRDEITAQLGGECLLADGVFDRTRLRKIVFEDATKRLALEAVLHPRIRAAWVSQSQIYQGNGQYYVAEIPLLYETDSALYFDRIVVVEADAQVQLERLSSKRGWSLELAHRVIDAQMPAAEKIRRADIMILNHHTEKLLNDQVELLAAALLTQYA